MVVSRRPSSTRSRAASKSLACSCDRSAPHGVNGGLVDQVGEIGPRETRRAPGDGVQVDVGVEALAADVNGQNGASLGLVGQADLDVAVEPARAQQRRIEGLGPVGRGDHHHAGSGVEAVHLR